MRRRRRARPLRRKPAVRTRRNPIGAGARGARAGLFARFIVAATLAAFSSAPPMSGATPPTPDPSNVSRQLSSSFNFSYVVRVTPPAGTHNVRVAIPLPSSDEFQEISEVEIEASVKVRVHNDKGGAQFAYFTMDSSRTQSPFQVRVTFHVERYERRIDLASAIDPPGPFPKGVAAFLRPDKSTPVDAAIASVSREQTQGLATPLEKAHSIYAYVVSTVHTANGADVDAEFVAMARAAGIPARLDSGFLLPEGQMEGIVSGDQSWAEFYVNGIGWIPVDASQAAQYPAKQDAFFGAIDARRVMISTGHVGDVPSAPLSSAQNSAVYPSIEMDGKPSPNFSLDFFFDEAKFTTTRFSVVRKAIFAVGAWMASGRSTRFPS
jgi:hypothetical protein